MICDAHIIIGDLYRNDGKVVSYSPRRICSILRKFGVDEFIYSSASMVWRNKSVDTIHKETAEMQKLFGRGAHPFLWVTKRYLRDDPSLSILRFGFYEGVYLGVEGIWKLSDEKLERVFSIAEELKKPVTICTSYDSGMATWFFEPIKRHPNVRFNLAHGCTFQQTLKCLHAFENVFVDISGMADEDVHYLATSEYASRTLWGTNFPVAAVRYGESLTANMRRNILVHNALSKHVDFTSNFRRYLVGV